MELGEPEMFEMHFIDRTLYIQLKPLLEKRFKHQKKDGVGAEKLFKKKSLPVK